MKNNVNGHNQQLISDFQSSFIFPAHLAVDATMLGYVKQALDANWILAFTDVKGVITYANDKFCELSKYSEEELLGQTHSIINSGYHPPQFFKWMYKTITNGEVWKGEIRNQAKDGSFYWVETIIVPFSNEEGQIYQYVSIRNDITEKKSNERRLLEVNDQLLTLSRTDGLTGIYNKRYFNEILAIEWEKSVERSLPISAIMIDIDHFKLYNDYYGHQEGDYCLQKIANVIKHTMKDASPGSYFARYGGEEIVLLLPQETRENVLYIAELVRCAVEKLSLPHLYSVTADVVTVSLGVATLTGNEFESAQQLLLAADQALYQAKRNHRNTVNEFEAEMDVITKIIQGTTVDFQENPKFNVVRDYLNELNEYSSVTYVHCIRTGYLAFQLAKRLKVMPDEVEDVYVAALLHDVGKLNIPLQILHKPGRLTNEEYEIIKEHSMHGLMKVSTQTVIRQYPRIMQGILHHHERWDGRGYPFQLRGEEIPRIARILAVIDAFDSMTSRRPYNDGMSDSDALVEVQRCSGSQFDPYIVDCFVELCHAHPNLLHTLNDLSHRSYREAIIATCES